MNGIRKIARACYDKASEEEKNATEAFIKKLDANGDGKISLEECSWLIDEKLFRQLDGNGNGTLDFHEALALYYMYKVVIPRCDGCRDLLIGPYFSCWPCQAKDPKTCDLCCDCYQGGTFKHEHEPSDFKDHHALLMLYRQRNTDAHKHQGKQEMEELREIARAHYQAGSPEVQAIAHEFFRCLDTDGDERVALREFLSFMKQEGYVHMDSPNFFRELDRDGNGTRNFIPGIFFSCVECYNIPKGSFTLCCDCYGSDKCNHNHNGKTQFLDSYTLLEAQKTKTMTTTGSTNLHNAASYGNPSSSSPQPSYSTAIVPAPTPSNWKEALKVFEVALSIGSIATTLCSIL